MHAYDDSDDFSDRPATPEVPPFYTAKLGDAAKVESLLGQLDPGADAALVLDARPWTRGCGYDASPQICDREPLPRVELPFAAGADPTIRTAKCHEQPKLARKVAYELATDKAARNVFGERWLTHRSVATGSEEQWCLRL